MPARHSIPLETKLHAIALLDSANSSIRSVAKIIDIPKSTLHDNRDHYRNEAKQFEEWQENSEKRTIRCVLSMNFDGISSSRRCSTVLSKQLWWKLA